MKKILSILVMLLITSSINSSSINSTTIDAFTAAPGTSTFDNGCRDWSYSIWVEMVHSECFTWQEEMEIASWLWDLCDEAGGAWNMQEPVFIE